MKKLRFNLLTKIILLTGVLTILTVSTSLTVNLLISYQNTKKTYIKSCEHVTDNIESIFAPNAKSIEEIANIVIERYNAIEGEYDEMTPEDIENYQSNLRIELFGPPDGSGYGMSYEKSLRKGFYTESIARMQYLCSSYKVPYASLSLYDSENKTVVDIINSDLSIDNNFGTIGLKSSDPSQEIQTFLDNNGVIKTITAKDAVYSYNILELDLSLGQYKCFIQGQYPLADYNKSLNQQILTQFLITAGSAIFLVIIYAIFTKLFLVNNVHKLTNSTNKFVSKMKNDEPLEIVDTNIKTSDEIRDLSDEFTLMQGQIINYVANIKEAKSIEQAFNAEVGVASKIQLESLPTKTYFDKNIELRAFIKPAKGVGGDFYDYFYIDQDHLAVVIADVSGKGIPASLFMMRSKESIRSAAMNEKDLAKVFFKVNNSLCINNKEGYFVTAFLGVLNLKTYEFDFISSGHERPFIKHGEECKRLEVESNFVLGLEEDFEYKKQKTKLQEGDTILLYTDGLNEAINSEEEEFGYERIAKSLQKDALLKQNVETIIKDLEEFIGKAEQFDDITILSFNIKQNVTSFSYLNPTYDDITDLTGKVEEYLEDLDPIILSKIGVVIDEVMNNIISYGKTKTNKMVTISVEKTDGGATLVFVDNSHPFNPLLRENRTVQENMDEGIVGGLGISIVKSISEESEYAYSNNKNILVIKF